MNSPEDVNTHIRMAHVGRRIRVIDVFVHIHRLQWYVYEWKCEWNEEKTCTYMRSHTHTRSNEISQAQTEYV